MPEPLDLSPPEIPEAGLFETLLRYGLFCGAIFQLICVLAIIFPGSKGHDTEHEPEPKSSEVSRKPKIPAAAPGKKQKKETKKKR
ncbi:protein MANBAL [Spea bombifrons]|uniref:protein MANBAL n=1 Tax=Spea bombifrons TaxID=233779 RepID=UPI00234A924F|nr:protein MANBAL [Spea bombifrons]